MSDVYNCLLFKRKRVSEAATFQDEDITAVLP